MWVDGFWLGFMFALAAETIIMIAAAVLGYMEDKKNNKEGKK